jgi:WD40 repeat protein
VKVWDVETGQELHSLVGGGPNVAFSPVGKRLASLGFDGTVKVWDVQTGQEILTFKLGAQYGPSSLAFSPDGTRLAWASFGRSGQKGTVTVWDAQTGQETLTLTDIRSRLVAFSPDGHRLATGSIIYDATPLPEKP